ncbi:MAG: beta-propeller fold lactonase family protein [Acholeplasma sp.]|nr:beta-propeller fold lactonase family protein [Acholeplasma sp.]
MKIFAGSYHENIYEIILNKNNNTLAKKTYIKTTKPSYIMNLNGLAYLHTKDNLQYINLENQNVLLTEPSCHISYDEKNQLVYSSSYHNGLLKVLAKENSMWFVKQTLSFGDKSKIHYADFIPTINLTGICDLGLNKLNLYKVTENQELQFHASYFFNETGPRHFVFHNTLPIVYVLNELKPSIDCLIINEKGISLLQHIELTPGAGSAIRITKDNKQIFAAVRDANYLFNFSVLDDGTLSLKQKISSFGDHPRDFNLIDNDKHLLLANMKSDNIILYKIENSLLIPIIIDFNIKAISSIISL